MSVMSLRKRTVPSEFTGLIHGDIYGGFGVGRASHTVDIDYDFRRDFSGMITSIEVCVDPVNGLDTNNGQRRFPLKTVRAAWMTGAGLINLLPGLYTEKLLMKGSDFGSPHAAMIKVWSPNTVTFTNPGTQAYDRTWTVGSDSTYSAPALSNLLDAVFVDDAGRRVFLTPRNSAAEVASSLEGWYVDPSTKIPTIRYGNENINAIKTQITFTTQAAAGQSLYHNILGANVYIEGVNFNRFGGFWCEYEGTKRPSLYQKNTTMQYGATHHVYSWGANTRYQGVESRFALAGDGFNYNVQESTQNPATSIEVDCYSHGHGIKKSLPFVSLPQRIKNGSSGHDKTTVVRLNSRYNDNFGPNIADTGAHKTWMISCDTSNPRQEAGDTPGVCVQLEGTGYLDQVTAGGETAGTGFQIVSGATVKGFDLESTAATQITGTLTDYDPTA